MKIYKFLQILLRQGPREVADFNFESVIWFEHPFGDPLEEFLA